MKPICPYVRRAWYDELEVDIPERVIYDYELAYIKEGHVTVTVEDQVYHAGPGDIFLFKPKKPHSILLSGSEKVIQPHIHFDLIYRENRETIPVSFKNLSEISPERMNDFHEDITEEIIPGFPDYVRLPSALYFEQLLFNVIYAYNNRGAFYEMTMNELFLRLWIYLLNQINFTLPSQKNDKDNHISKLRYYIESNLNRPISIDELCSIAHFSKGHIIKLFHDHYNTTPLAFHAMLRMEKAKTMIEYTNLPLKTISTTLGFETQQDFSRTFKRTVGCSPSEYRERSSSNATPTVICETLSQSDRTK